MKIKKLNQNSVLVVDSFFQKAPLLRQEFEKRFNQPHTADSSRFIWDHWHIPNQYTLLRTPAYHFFTESLYNQLHTQLLKFGREVLGCYDITPPWLSCYVEGCKQEIHADVPHGPWAFVYSLTPWTKRSFKGGETFIMKPETLQYWHHFSNLKGVEKPDLMTTIAPQMNRLTVFDPRLPHGVQEVRNAESVLDGRLVIHGWFKDPEPYVTGSLTRTKAAAGLNLILEKIFQKQNQFEDVHGTLSYQIKISASGQVIKTTKMTDTLQSLTNSTTNTKKLLALIESAIREQKFARAKGPSTITFPILFRF